MFKWFEIIKLKLFLRREIAVYKFYRNAQKEPGISREDEALYDYLRREAGIFINEIQCKIHQLQTGR